MGGHHSRPTFNPPPLDPMFIDIGCIGLKKDDYTGAYNQLNGKQFPVPTDSILTQAPFLYIPFFANSFDDIKLKIKHAFDLVATAAVAPTPVILDELSLVTAGSSLQQVYNALITRATTSTSSTTSDSTSSFANTLSVLFKSGPLPESDNISPAPAPAVITAPAPPPPIYDTNPGVDPTLEGFVNRYGSNYALSKAIGNRLL